MYFIYHLYVRVQDMDDIYVHMYVAYVYVYAEVSKIYNRNLFSGKKLEKEIHFIIIMITSYVLLYFLVLSKINNMRYITLG